jgi:uncharacterized protein (DUF2336 family)
VIAPLARRGIGLQKRSSATASAIPSPRTTNCRPGEGEYGQKEKVIRELLAEAGDRVGKSMAQRLYNLVDLPHAGHHLLRLEPEAGTMGYAFTFG